MRTYSWALFRNDVVAGITVALVALPLSLAIAIASGAAPVSGLVTAVIAGFLVSALGGSRVQIGGPTGAFIVVVYGVIHQYGYDGLVLATLIAGVILLIAGVLRAGALITYVPEAVVNGFTVGIAIVIATSQLKDVLGLSVDAVPADFLHKIEALWVARETVNGWSLALAAATIGVIVAVRRLAPTFPGSAVAIGLASAAALGLGLPVETLGGRFGELPSSLPMPQLPAITWERVVELLPSAFIIAFLAGVESLLSALVADRMVQGQHRPHAEVLAQGAANIGSALFGGMPATGAIARTATNVRAGGRTPVAGIVHALCVLAIMMVAAPLASHLAMSALAALLILTAWYMSEPHTWRERISGRRTDTVLFLLTMVLTVVVDLTVAVGVGVAAGLAIRLRRRDVPPTEWTTPKR